MTSLYTKLIYHCLNKAEVPELEKHPMLVNLVQARDKAKGLFLHKLKVRLFKSKEIAKLLDWNSERLIDKHPDLFDYDIAPIKSITCNGDNANWVMTSEGGRPEEGQSLDTDPNSLDYKLAVNRNYWCKGKHPRSVESRVAWYKRNAGEALAYRLGLRIAPTSDFKTYTYTTPRCSIKIYSKGCVQLLELSLKLIGKLSIKLRTGYEVTNAFDSRTNTQLWYPINNYELRATLTHSILPTWNKNE